MVMLKSVAEIRAFAERVERLCEHLESRAQHSDDRTAIIDLKNEAADIATMDDLSSDNVLAGVKELINR